MSIFILKVGQNFELNILLASNYYLALQIRNKMDSEDGELFVKVRDIKPRLPFSFLIFSIRV